MPISKVEQDIRYKVGSNVYNKAVERLEKHTECKYVEGYNTETGEKQEFKEDIAHIMQKRRKFEKRKLSFTGLGGLLGKK